MGTAAFAQPQIRIRTVPLAMLSDERLAELAGEGDDGAFAALYERYRGPLSRYCRSIVRDGDDAADAFQNTMISALRGLRREPPSGRVKPWLYRIAHNESISLLRRRRPDEELVAELPEHRAGSAGSADGGVGERLDTLLGDLRQLPERQRGALVMRELAGLEYAEIGRVFETSAVAARKAVYEARVSLAQFEQGRDAACHEIMRELSDGDGRARRARRVRGHLAVCSTCFSFEHAHRERRRALALVPALPGLPLTALLTGSVGGGAGAGKAIVGGAALGSGAGGSAIGGAFGSGAVAAVKCLSLCGALAAAGAGVVVAEHAVHPARPNHAAPVVAHVAHVAAVAHPHRTPAPARTVAATRHAAAAAPRTGMVATHTPSARTRTRRAAPPSGFGGPGGGTSAGGGQHRVTHLSSSSAGGAAHSTSAPAAPAQSTAPATATTTAAPTTTGASTSSYTASSGLALYLSRSTAAAAAATTIAKTLAGAIASAIGGAGSQTGGSSLLSAIEQRAQAGATGSLPGIENFSG